MGIDECNDRASPRRREALTNLQPGFLAARGHAVGGRSSQQRREGIAVLGIFHHHTDLVALRIRQRVGDDLGRGEAVIVGDHYGVRITELISAEPGGRP